MYSSTRNKQKRGALADLGVDINNVRDPRKAEGKSKENEVDDIPIDVGDETGKMHRRKSSVAKSIVGSLRGFNRRGLKSPISSPTKEEGIDNIASPTRRAAAVPLPSSPIDIPAPPQLKLDLGDAANISTAWITQSPLANYRNDIMSATDPRNHTSPRVPSRLPSQGPDDCPISPTRASKLKPLAASELLRLPADDFHFGMPEASPATAAEAHKTTNLDGANDARQVFERSVEAKDGCKKQGNKSLKKMASIDALAEQHIEDSPRRGIRLTPVPAKTRNVSQATTVESAPSDMPPLCRQTGSLHTPTADHGDSTADKWRRADPFAPGDAADDLLI